MANRISPVPVRAQAVDKAGMLTPPMAGFLQAVRQAAGEDGPVLQVYAKADAPDPAKSLGRIIWVTDASAGAWAYISDGAHWRVLSTKAVLS